MVFEQLIGSVQQIHDVRALIEFGGLFLICAIVFVETGLFLGFFLPGDSLLFTAGVFAAAGFLNIYALLVFVTLCAILGDQLGYYIGLRMGKVLFKKEDSLLFKRKHIKYAQEYYSLHGSKTVILARFVPIVRTFAPVVAGAAEMDYKKFTLYNVVGGIAWVFAMVLAGFALGRLIPNIESYLHVVVLVIVALSVMPIVYQYWRARRTPKSVRAARMDEA